MLTFPEHGRAIGETIGERKRSSLQRVAAIGRRCLRRRDRTGGSRRARPGAVPHQRARFCRKACPRRRAHHCRVPARRASRPVRIVVERALPRLRRRARCGHHAQDGEPRRIRLRTMRLRLQADARRDGRGDLHGESARAPDRRPRSRDAAGSRILSPDFLQFGRRSAGEFGPEPRRIHHRYDRAATRREGGAIGATAR